MISARATRAAEEVWISGGRSGGDSGTRSVEKLALRTPGGFKTVKSWHRLPAPLSRRARRGSQYLYARSCPAWDSADIPAPELRGPPGYSGRFLLEKRRVLGINTLNSPGPSSFLAC